MATFDEFYQSLPEDSNKRGEFFEKVFVPWFLKTDPEWSSKIKQIWLWNEYPQRWGKDCGIDLVYEDNQGKHWAVQSKCVAPDREIAKAEIDSFLSESNDSRIYGRLLIASTDGIGKNALQVIDRQEKQVVCFLLEHFKHSAVEFPSSPEDLSTGQRKEKCTPRPHQQEAIKKVVKGFQKVDRGQLLMACGTGKTLTSLWIKEALKPKRTLVLLPSLSLLSQTLREWSANSKEQFNWICVCSDKSVAKYDKTTDSMIERVSGLGVPVTSDPKDIQDFLENEDGGVIFSTYQSSELVADSQKESSIPNFDITFADEAHRCTGKVSSAFACVLDEERIRSDKRLFMTATPRVLSKQIKKKADEENIILACMDDSSQFGDVFHQLNFSEAINREILSDYQVVIIGVDDPSVEAKINNRSVVETGNELQIDTETLANHIALAKAIKDYELSRMITFHSRVKSAKKFSEDHPLIIDWLPEDSKSSKTALTSYVSGEMNARDRNREINKLKDIGEHEVGILANARCLSEGVDVPTLDGIAFFDPRSSQVDIIQAVGRAIRKSVNKTDGYIILPVYLGDTSNVEDEILQSRFKDIWSIILALKSQDDSMRDELDQLRVELGRRNEPTESVKGLTKIIFDLPSSISTTFADSLRTILVRETTEDWIEMYGLLQRYWGENQRLPTTGKNATKFKGKNLGAWVNKQRNSKDRMTRQRVDLLNRLSFWVWDPFQEQWDSNLALLRQYASQYGHACPKAKEIYHGIKIGVWVGTQRTNKLKLSQYQKQELEGLQGWSWNPDEDSWKKYFNALNDFQATYGHASPKSKDLHQGLKIGNWINTQRSAYSKNILSTEKVYLLESINGWNWNSRDSAWEDKFLLLVDYANENKTACVPDDAIYKENQLGNWVQAQRGRYKKNQQKRSLSTEQMAKLESLPGWTWDLGDDQWRNSYALLKDYLSVNGHASPKNSEVYNDFELGKWVQGQRRSYKTKKISEERIGLLERLDGWSWDTLVDKWQSGLDLLIDFIDKNNTLPASKDKYKGFSIGFWCFTQRKNRLLLSDKQKEALDSIPLWEWAPDSQWTRSLKAFSKYYELTGDATPAQKTVFEENQIGNWVITQRVQYRKGRLCAERVKILESYAGWKW